MSPLTRPLDSGQHAAAVSIRSGFGSMTHDRVMRFVPVFDTSHQAAEFATARALDWLVLNRPSPHPSESRTEDSDTWPKKN